MKEVKEYIKNVINWVKSLLGTGYEKEIEQANMKAASEIKISEMSTGKIVPAPEEVKEVEDVEEVNSFIKGKFSEEEVNSFIKGKFSEEEVKILTAEIKDKSFKDIDWKKLSVKMNRKIDSLKTKARQLKPVK